MGCVGSCAWSLWIPLCLPLCCGSGHLHYHAISFAYALVWGSEDVRITLRDPPHRTARPSPFGDTFSAEGLYGYHPDTLGSTPIPPGHDLCMVIPFQRGEYMVAVCCGNCLHYLMRMPHSSVLVGRCSLCPLMRVAVSSLIGALCAEGYFRMHPSISQPATRLSC